MKDIKGDTPANSTRNILIANTMRRIIDSYVNFIVLGKDTWGAVLNCKRKGTIHNFWKVAVHHFRKQGVQNIWKQRIHNRDKIMQVGFHCQKLFF